MCPITGSTALRRLSFLSDRHRDATFGAGNPHLDRFRQTMTTVTAINIGFFRCDPRQVGMQSLPGNPYDGHTLKASLQQVQKLAWGETFSKASQVMR